MRLVDISPAVPRVAANPVLRDLRACAYLMTYPHLTAFLGAGAPVTTGSFLQLAAMTYGWMPRILRINAPKLPSAVAALHKGTVATSQSFRHVAVRDIADCLHSVVGASKMLHFGNAAVFPIWDSKIEAFRLGHDATATHMDDEANYFSFVDDVHLIRSEPGFSGFYADFQRAYSARQVAMGVRSYPLSEVRAIEAAAFELA